MPTLSKGAYDKLKFLTQILLPALGTLYFALADLWTLPNAFEVVGTIMAVDTFLGVLLGLSTAHYNASDGKFDGEIEIQENVNGKAFVLNLNSDPYELENKNEVIFKVNPPN